MKTGMKSRLLAILMSLAMVLTMIPTMYGEVYARENSAPAVIKGGDVSNFAKDAPVSTITIDRSKIHKDNLVFIEPGKLDQLPNPGSNITFTYNDGYAYAEGVYINADYRRLGNFSFVYKDAAVMHDGTKANLEVIFDEIHIIRQNDQPTYENEKVRIAYAGDSGDGNPLALTPVSVNYPDKHFVIRSEIKFRVGKAGVVSDEEQSFLFTASDIDIKNNSSNIVNVPGNMNYSESVEPMYGINSESDIYLPQSTNITDNPSGGGWNTTPGGYEHRFMVDSRISPPSTHTYDYGMAIVARAGGSEGDRKNNGFITRAWAASGPDFEQAEIDFMNYDLTHSFTSSSGVNGKIELWTDGQIHEADAEENKFRKLDGGTTAAPYTYAVPRGKEVTYKITPDSGYILDTLTVNDSEVYPTKIVYNPYSTEVDYYEYTFAEDKVNEDSKIRVTWKLPVATSKPIPVHKVVAGDVPDKDQEFTFVLERKQQGPDWNKRSNQNDVEKITLEVEKGQSEASSQFSALTFEEPGTYIYEVRELNKNAAGYTYDDKVYTVAFVVEPDQNNPGNLIITWHQILDDGDPVETCEFVNTYKRKDEPDPTPTPKQTYDPLLAKMKAGKTSMTMAWNKVKGADGYDIFFARCDHRGKELVCKKVRTIKGNSTFRWKKSGLKKGKAYKSYVKAYVIKNGKKKYVRKSPMAHAYTANGTKKYTNAKSVKVKNVKKGKLTLNKGRTFKLKAKVNKVKKNRTLMSKRHAPKLRYMTSNSSVATVSKSGRIRAKGSGTCTIVAFAHNGVYKKIRLTVK